MLQGYWTVTKYSRGISVFPSFTWGYFTGNNRDPLWRRVFASVNFPEISRFEAHSCRGSVPGLHPYRNPVTCLRTRVPCPWGVPIAASDSPFPISVACRQTLHRRL